MYRIFEKQVLLPEPITPEPEAKHAALLLEIIGQR